MERCFIIPGAGGLTEFWRPYQQGALLRLCRCWCKNFHRGHNSLFSVSTDGNQVS